MESRKKSKTNDNNNNNVESNSTLSAKRKKFHVGNPREMDALSKQTNVVYANPYENAEIRLESVNGPFLEFSNLKGYVVASPRLKGEFMFIAGEDYIFDQTHPVYLGIYHGKELSILPQNTTYVFQFGSKIIDGGPEGNHLRWVNHSKYRYNLQPIKATVYINGARAQVVLYQVMTNVKKRQQLLVNYGDDYIFNESPLYFHPDDNDQSLEEVFAKNRTQYTTMHYQLFGQKQLVALNETYASYYIPKIVSCMNHGMAELKDYLEKNTKTINVDLPFLAVNSKGELEPIEKQSNMTPLMYAAFTGNLAAMGMLIANGADIERRNIFTGHTALFYAIVGAATPDEKQGMISLLIKHDINVMAQDCDGLTIFHWCVKNNDFESLMFLCRNIRGDKVLKYLEKDGLCPVMYALALDKRDLFAYLLGRYKKGLNKDVKQLSSQLKIAKKLNQNFLEYIKLLREEGFGEYLDEKSGVAESELSSSDNETDSNKGDADNKMRLEGTTYEMEQDRSDVERDMESLEENHDSDFSENDLDDELNDDDGNNNNAKRRKISAKNQKKQTLSNKSGMWSGITFELGVYNNKYFITVLNADKSVANSRRMYKTISKLRHKARKAHPDGPFLLHTGRRLCSFCCLYLENGELKDLANALKKLFPKEIPKIQIKSIDLNEMPISTTLDVFVNQFEQFNSIMPIPSKDELDFDAYLDESLKKDELIQKKSGVVIENRKAVKNFDSNDKLDKFLIEFHEEMKIVSWKQNNGKNEKNCKYVKIISIEKDAVKLFKLYKLIWYRNRQGEHETKVTINHVRATEFIVAFVGAESNEECFKRLTAIFPNTITKLTVEIVHSNGERSVQMLDNRESKNRKRKLSDIKQAPNQENDDAGDVAPTQDASEESNNNNELCVTGKIYNKKSQNDSWQDFSVELYEKKKVICYQARHRANYKHCMYAKIIANDKNSAELFNFYRIVYRRKKLQPHSSIVTIDHKGADEFTVGFMDAESLDQCYKNLTEILPATVTIFKVTTFHANGEQTVQTFNNSESRPKKTSVDEKPEQNEIEDDDSINRSSELGGSLDSRATHPHDASLGDDNNNNNNNKEAATKEKTTDSLWDTVFFEFNLYQDNCYILVTNENNSIDQSNQARKYMSSPISKKQNTDQNSIFIKQVGNSYCSFFYLILKPSGSIQDIFKVLLKLFPVISEKITVRYIDLLGNKVHISLTEFISKNSNQLDPNIKINCVAGDSDLENHLVKILKNEAEKNKQNNAQRTKHVAPKKSGNQSKLWDDVHINIFSKKKEFILNASHDSKKECWYAKIFSTANKNIFSVYKELSSRLAKSDTKVAVNIKDASDATVFTVIFIGASSFGDSVKSLKAILPKKAKQIQINAINDNCETMPTEENTTQTQSNENNSTEVISGSIDTLMPYATQVFFKSAEAQSKPGQNKQNILSPPGNK